MLARCQVYERSQQYRTCGAGVSVSANGLKSIRAVSPELHAQFQARAEHFDSMEQLDQHGKVHCYSGTAPAVQPHHGLVSGGTSCHIQDTLHELESHHAAGPKGP